MSQNASCSPLHRRHSLQHLSVATLVVVTALLSWSNPASAQWSLVSPTSPPTARTDSAIAYDFARQRTVLFGGFPGNTETHTWDGSAWTAAAASGPPVTWAGAMAYEPSTSTLVLFGGRDAAAPHAQTWRWTGTAWIRQFPSGSPAARYYHAMATDQRRGRVVLFGGQVGAGAYLGDTWEWDGIAWQQRAVTGPSARSGHKLAWDPRREKVILFGGAGSVGALGDTWEWNGTAWTFLTAAGPAADPNPAMATVGANVALFKSEGSARTWTWNGSLWQPLTSPSEPTIRTGAAMAADVNGAVLFGGYNVLFGHYRETWKLRVAASRLYVPTGADTVEANSLLPIGGTARRRIQTTIDAAAFPPSQRVGLLHGVHLRRDGSTTLFSGRTIDLRVTLGPAAAAPIAMSTNFVANWATTPTLVYQGTISVPTSLAGIPAPAPFQVALPFANPWLWNAQSLSLEIDMTATSLLAQYDVDAASRPQSAGIVTAVGQSCAGASGPPVLRLPNAATLMVGGAIDIGLTAARPGAVAFSVLGDSDTNWAGTPLPFQWPGTTCNVYHNWVVQQVALVRGDGTASATYPIPPQTYLSGTRLFSQWAVYEGVAGPPLVTSAMARMTIGPVPAALWDTISNTDGSTIGAKSVGAWLTPVYQFELN